VNTHPLFSFLSCFRNAHVLGGLTETRLLGEGIKYIYFLPEKERKRERETMTKGDYFRICKLADNFVHVLSLSSITIIYISEYNETE